MCFSNLGKGDGKTRNRNLWERKDVYEKKENELQIDWKHFIWVYWHWSFRWHFRI